MSVYVDGFIVAASNLPGNILTILLMDSIGGKLLLCESKATSVEGDSDISLWYIKIGIEHVSSIHNCKVNRKSFITAKLPAYITGIRAEVIDWILFLLLLHNQLSLWG